MRLFAACASSSPAPARPKSHGSKPGSPTREQTADRGGRDRQREDARANQHQPLRDDVDLAGRGVARPQDEPPPPEQASLARRARSVCAMRCSVGSSRITSDYRARSFGRPSRTPAPTNSMLSTTSSAPPAAPRYVPDCLTPALRLIAENTRSPTGRGRRRRRRTRVPRSKSNGGSRTKPGDGTDDDARGEPASAPSHVLLGATSLFRAWRPRIRPTKNATASCAIDHQPEGEQAPEAEARHRPDEKDVRARGRRRRRPRRRRREVAGDAGRLHAGLVEDDPRHEQREHEPGDERRYSSSSPR